jgi:hypothetical protein
MLISTTTANRTTTLESCAAAKRLEAPKRGWEECVNMGSSIATELGVAKIKLNN